MKFKLTTAFCFYRIRLLKVIMRTFVFLFCTAVFSLSPNNGFSQNADIQINNSETISVEAIFELIKSQTDYSFVFRPEHLKNAPEINVQKGIIKAYQLLKMGLDPIDCTYEFTDNTVIVKQKIHPVLNVPMQETFTIEGTVKDKDGNPIPGAAVYVTSRNPSLSRDQRATDFIARGTSTDFDGKFKIDATLNHFLAISALGFQFHFQQIVSTDETYEIILTESTAQLDEVVVVGFGSTVRKDLTGSVASVNSEKVTQVKTATIDQALVGQLSGVFVESNAGAPGAGASVNIRGLSQINGDNQPLYVIDGVPVVVNTNFGTFNGAANRENPLLAIDPNNIDRIDVLKDASSAAIYGSRGANGVILVTTKKGRKNQQPRFNFSLNTTFLEETNKIDYLNASQYRTFATEQAQVILDGLPPNFRPFFTVPFAIVNDPNGYFGNNDTDWQDEILNNNAVWNQYSFTVSGGTSRTTYFASASVNEQDGLLLGNKLQRYNFSANLESQIKDYLKIGGNINYTYGVNKQSGINTFGQANFRPDLSPFDSDGNPTSVVSSNGFRGRLTLNPLENHGKISDKAISQNVIGSVYGEARIVKGLKLKSQLNIGLTNDKSSVFSPSFTGVAINAGNNNGFSGDAILANQVTDGYTTSFVNTLNYNTVIDENHRIDAVLGVSWDRNFLNFETQNYNGFPDDIVLTNINSASNVYNFSSSSIESGLNSIFGRVNYNYKDRYLVTFTARSDGSVKFGPENQRGFFPSAGVAWNIHNEEFFGDDGFISQLKLRASLGRTGTDNLPAFSFLAYYTSLGRGSFYDGINGIQVTNLPNPVIKWETTDQLDLGLEFGLFDGRVNGEIVYFEKNTSDLILFTPVPSETGFQDFNANIADVSNNGIEFTLGADIIKTKDFNWNSSFNISFVKNNVDALNGGTNNNSGFGSALNGISVGEPIGFINGYEVVSIAQDQNEIDVLNAGAQDGNYFSGLRAPGDYIYRDINGDGEITEEDVTNLGDINPDYFGGWNNTITYKNFDLSFNLQFVQGNSRNWAIPGRFGASRVDLSFNHPIQILDTWSANNTAATYARLGSSTHNPGGVATSRDVYDGSYTRLRYLGLGYNLPKEFVNKIGLNAIRLNISGNNLFTISDYPGQDPENVNVAQGGSSISRSNDLGFAYPQAKTFTFGINVSF